MKDYVVFYGKILKALETHPRLTPIILGYNWLVTKLMYILYPCLLAFVYLREGQIPWLLILIPGIGFTLVSLFRKVINQPRPHEKWAITPLMKRDGQGESFPSRHVFSATIISMCFLTVNVFLGLVLLCMSIGLGLCRVMGGVHYPKDVLAAYLLGILLGLLLFL